MLVTLSVSVASWLRGNIRKGMTMLQGMYTGSYAGKPIWRGVINGLYINQRECEYEHYIKLLWDMTVQGDQAILRLGGCKLCLLLLKETSQKRSR